MFFDQNVPCTCHKSREFYTMSFLYSSTLSPKCYLCKIKNSKTLLLHPLLTSSRLGTNIPLRTLFLRNLVPLGWQKKGSDIHGTRDKSKVFLFYLDMWCRRRDERAYKCDCVLQFIHQITSRAWTETGNLKCLQFRSKEVYSDVLRYS